VAEISIGPAVTRATSATTSVFTDMVAMSARCLRITRRNYSALIVPIMLPVMLMLMFVYLFGGAIHTGTKYVTYVVPGILLLCAGFGSALTATSVSRDMADGIVDRFRSMDVSGAAVLAGHVTASVARNIASTALVIATALLIGFRPAASLTAWLAALGILFAYILAISWFSAAMGTLFKSPEATTGFTFTVMFLPYPSSAFVPVDTLPTWIRGFATHQPVTPIIQSIRALLLGHSAGPNPAVALAWCAGILVVAIVLAGVLFQRRAE
jgi:ABC-2 type transport system permease protein